jgi:hypothetical protein
MSILLRLLEIHKQSNFIGACLSIKFVFYSHKYRGDIAIFFISLTIY